MYKLYHYVHCPYCIRVRLALGYLERPYESVVLAYDDEKTPASLTGAKMLPILTFPDGHHQNESLAIISKLDEKKSLGTLSSQEMDDMDHILSQISSPLHNLAMPYWIYTKEFDESSRKYFQLKHEKKRGPFGELMKKKKIFMEELSEHLEKLAGDLTPWLKGNQFGLKDILLASHLWGAYIAPEFQFSPSIHNYLQSISQKCRFHYHEDFCR
ncbi:MAG: glutaredoxin 2 [Bacteriovoracales bacterium]|nr:glutaredoxin 2 [Bacteriovoracales bacterium]